MPRRPHAERAATSRPSDKPNASSEDALLIGDPRSPVQAHPEGAVVAVVAVPRSGVTAIDRLEGDAIRIRLAAPPVDGAANAALLRLLADVLGVPRSGLRVVAGETARRKRVLVAGRSAAVVAEGLSRRLPA